MTPPAEAAISWGVRVATAGAVAVSMHTREEEMQLHTSMLALDQQLSIYLPELPPSLGSNQLGGMGMG